MNAKHMSYFKDVIAAVERSVGAFGFIHKRQGIFLKPLSDDCVAFLGLNKAGTGNSQEIEVNPVLGIRNRPIEKLVAELNGTQCDPIVPPTLAGNIGYMTPHDRYSPFLFRGQQGLDFVATELSEAVFQYGVPFVTNLVSLPKLVTAMLTVRFRNNLIVDYRIPVGYYLLGEAGHAESFLNERLARLEGRTDAAARHYIHFASRLLALCAGANRL